MIIIDFHRELVGGIEKYHKSRIFLKCLEPAYLVGYAYILTENFGFGEFFSFLDV